MDRRFKILTIALSVIYMVMIGGYAQHMAAAFVDGFKKGFKAGLESAETGTVPTRSASGTFFLTLKPIDGFHTFPTTSRNQKDRQPMKVEIERMSVELSKVSELLPRGTITTDICTTFLTFFILFVMVFIPVQTFHILRSITRDKIFDLSNIRRLRFIGYALLAYYIAGFVVNILQYRIATNVVEVDGYKLQVDWGNTSLVFLGFVVLMFAEILKVSVTMKEEQDLTV